MSTTTTTISPRPEQGQLVSVRARKWVVTEVLASTLPPPRLQTGLTAPQHLLSLSSVEDDGLGEELNVIWELEPGARVVEKVGIPHYYQQMQRSFKENQDQKYFQLLQR